jgi:hypothetical protein
VLEEGQGSRPVTFAADHLDPPRGTSVRSSR